MDLLTCVERSSGSFGLFYQEGTRIVRTRAEIIGRGEGSPLDEEGEEFHAQNCCEQLLNQNR